MDYQPPKTTQELIQRYAQGERTFFDVDFCERDLQGNYPNFDGAQLTNIVFYSSFICASFRGACLRNAIFRCNMKGSDFTKADVRNASFVGCAVDGTIFDGAKLEGAIFAGAFYQGCELKEGEYPEQED